MKNDSFRFNITINLVEDPMIFEDLIQYSGIDRARRARTLMRNGLLLLRARDLPSVGSSHYGAEVLHSVPCAANTAGPASLREAAPSPKAPRQGTREAMDAVAFDIDDLMKNLQSQDGSAQLGLDHSKITSILKAEVS